MFKEKMIEDIVPESKIKRAPLMTNLVLSGITTAAGFISGTVLIMVLGHLLTVVVFGEVVYAATFANLALLIPSYGFPLLIVREISQQRLSPSNALVNVLVAQVLLSLVTLVGLGIFMAFSQMQPGFYLVLLIFVVSGVLNAFSTVISAINKGVNDFTVEAKTAVIKSLSLCALVFGALVVLPHTSMTVGWTMLASNIFGFVTAMVLVRPLIRTESGLFPSCAIVRNLLWIGFPFALQLILGTLYFQIDTLIIGQLLNMEEVAFYQAAARLIMATIPVSMIINNAFYPQLTRVYDPKTRKFTSSDPQKMLGVLLALGVSGTLFFVILARPIISIIYGQKMLPSVLVLQIFALVLLFRFVASGYGMLLIACGRQTILVWAAGSAAFLTVVLNLTLVPRYGIVASAWANVASNLLVLIFCLCVYYDRPRIWLSHLLRNE